MHNLQAARLELLDLERFKRQGKTSARCTRTLAGTPTEGVVTGEILEFETAPREVIRLLPPE